VKDNIDVAGVPTTYGFGGRHPPATADAEVIRRLRAAGAVILGKLNMQEGALGAVNDNPHHGRTSNPYRDGYTPGGSSGGSGAAVRPDFARRRSARTQAARCASLPPIAGGD
jgi:aspartyl-tRNA(Asn)/glutamyl-tRNA(Gln) amidotransferase subunit A